MVGDGIDEVHTTKGGKPFGSPPFDVYIACVLLDQVNAALQELVKGFALQHAVL